MDGRVSIPGRGKRFSSSPQRPYRLCLPSASYPTGAASSFPGGKAVGDVELTTDLHLVPRSRMEELYLHSPIRLHGMMLN
jgi:hypothetical protein